MINRFQKDTAVKRKEEPDIGDVCLLCIEKSVKSLHQTLPAVITEVAIQGKQQKYKLCSKFGHVDLLYSCLDLVHEPELTATMLQIDVNTKENLTTQKVMNKYEPFIGCACQTNCGKSSHSKCKLSGM